MTRDSYTGESDESESLHLYTYCENDGINLVDFNGHDAASIAVTWSSSAWWLCGIDGPYPIGDVIYAGGVLITGGAALISICDSDRILNESKESKLKRTYVNNNKRVKKSNS